jgi:hypothetical protein
MAQVPTYANSFLKENYSGVALLDETYKKYPFLRLLKKRANTDYLNGKYHVYPVDYMPAGAGSADFGTAYAQGQLSNDTTVEFQLPPVTYSVLQFMDSVTYLQAMKSQGSFIDLLTKRSNNAVSIMLSRLSQEIWGNGVQPIGTVASFSGATITLTNNTDSVYFFPGSTFVDAAQFAATGGTRARGSSIGTVGMQLLSVDQVTGVLTFNANVTDAANGIPTLANGDSLFNAGDRNSAATATSIIGLGGLCPRGGVASNDFFYNVNRSTSRQLYGTTFDARSIGQIPQALQDAMTKSHTLIEGEQTHLFMHPTQYNALTKQLASQYRYTQAADRDTPKVGADWTESDEGRIILPGVDINGPSGPVRCVSDRSCPTDTVWGVNEEDLDFMILNDGFEPWNLDGNDILRVNAQDKLELRFCGYHNFFVKRPKNLLNIQVTPISL